MQRAAAASSSALRRLVAEAIARPPILSRAASLVSTTFSRPLAASDGHRQLTLLYPIYHPSRGYAKGRNFAPSDEDEDDDDDDDVEEDYVNSDESGEDDDEDEDEIAYKSEMSD